MNLARISPAFEGRVVSSIAGDPELGDLVEMYVQEMPQRIESLADCVSMQDWTRLGCLAHQIKGSAGSYGFEQLTHLAASLENACRVLEDPESTLVAYDRLVDAMRRAEL